MRSHSGVAATLFDVLYRAGVNIEMISTSEIKISVIIREDKGISALKAVHRALGLDKPPAERNQESVIGK